MMNRQDLWKELHDLFDTDDGSLPEIRIADLSKLGVASIFAKLQGLCPGGVDGNFWSNEAQKDRRVDSVPNAAQLVIDDRSEPFHALCHELDYGGIRIPDLGVFVSDDEISLDYRMGSEWNANNLGAFLQLLKELTQLDANASISLERSVLRDVRKRFEDTWKAFMENTSAT
jgi:hypothetical protein